MAFILLGSFPNSQVKPRPSTQDESVPNVDVPADTVTTLVAANPDRTVLTILNEGPTDCRWRTANEGDPSDTEGFLLIAGSSVEITSKEEIKGYCDGGITKFSTQEGIG